MGDHIHRPAVAQHFIRLRITDWKSVCVRHGLEAFTFRHGQLANDVKSVCQFNGVCLSFDGDPPAANLVNWDFFSACRLNYKLPFPVRDNGHGIQAGGRTVGPAAVRPCLQGNALAVRAVNAAALAGAQFAVLVRHGADADGDGDHIVFFHG